MDIQFINMMTLRIKLLLLFLLICSHSALYADGEAESVGDSSKIHANATLEGSAKIGSPEAEDVRDSRLPPVIPGEDVNDGSKKIRVWSSAGKVSSEIETKNSAVRKDSEILGNVVVDTRN